MSQQASKVPRASAKRGDPSNLFGPWAARKALHYQGSLHIFVIVNNIEIVNELLTDLLSFPLWG